jgi:hypothetical protein
MLTVIATDFGRARKENAAAEFILIFYEIVVLIHRCSKASLSIRPMQLVLSRSFCQLFLALFLRKNILSVLSH